METQTNDTPADDLSQHVATGRDTEQYTISVAEAAELFTIAGLPRTERAIQRFCKKGDLICAFQETAYGSRYLIKHSSIDRLIQQKLQALPVTPDTDGRDTSRPDATGRDTSRHDSDTPIVNEIPQPQSKITVVTDGYDTQQRQGATGRDDAEFKKLREENLELKIDNSARQQFINLLTGEVEKTRAQVQELSYQLGVAHTRVAQLEAPKPTTDTPTVSRPVAAMEAEEIVVPTPIGERRDGGGSPPPATPSAAPDLAKPSMWRRIFG